MYDINGNMQPLNILQSLSQGAQLGQNATEFRQKQQKYEQDQSDQKAVRDILNGDTSAIARLQSPELIQKAQEHLRELEKRKALQGFYHPATQDQYQATVTQNPIAAIMDGNKQPSNLVEKSQQPYQSPQNMLDMIQTGKIADGQPASYDLQGAGDYLLGQGNFADAKDLAAYRLSMAKEPDEWSTPTKGINEQGKPDTYLINKRGEKKWLGSGVYEAPKEVKTSLVKTSNGFEVVRDGELPKGAPPVDMPTPEKPITGYQKIKLEGELRDDYRNDSKTYLEIARQAKIIQSSLNDKSAAGTLASATAFMKMLDPGSVVRESELAMAMKTNGSLDRMGNYMNVIQSGQVLTAQQKADFAQLVKAYSNAANEAHEKTNERYGKIASEYGLEPKRVVLYDIEKQPTQSKQTDYLEYKQERTKAYKSGNMDLVRKMDEMAKQDGLIK